MSDRTPTSTSTSSSLGDEYTIGPLYLQDAPACAQLDARTFSQDGPWTEQMFRDALSSPHSVFYALRKQGELIGLAGRTHPADSRYPECEILTIAIDPSIQGQGWGRRLFQHLLKDVDHATIYLDVRDGNMPAQRLYESCGFTIVGRRPRYYWPSGADAHIMMRPLSHQIKERQAQ